MATGVNILETVKTIAREVYADQRDINRGGCCVYAAMLGERLQQYGVAIHGKIINPGGDSITAARNYAHANNRQLINIREWNRAGVIFWHVFLQFILNGELYSHDAEQTTKGKIAKFTGYDIEDGELSLEEMQTLAKDNDWNTMFDREDGIPIIQAIIDKYLPTRKP